MRGTKLPHSIEAERQILGAVLLNPDSLQDAMEVIKQEHFYVETNGLIFRYMMELYSENRPIDMVTLSDKIKSYGSLINIGYLGELASDAPLSTAVKHYAKIVFDKWRLRQLIMASTNVIAEAREQPEDVESLIGEHEEKIFSLASSSKEMSCVEFSSGAEEYFGHIDDLQSGKITPGILCGIERIDNFMGGFEEETFSLIAARPAVGKTSLALQMACNMSMHKPILFCSLEMSKRQIQHKVFGLVAKVNHRRMKYRSTMCEDEWERLADAMQVVKKMKLHVSARAGLSPLEIYNMARQIKRKRGELGAIFVDYLQLCKPNNARRNGTRENEVSEVSGAFKVMASAIGCPVIALSQLNREVTKRANGRPKLSDLRDSGSLEQDTDSVIFIHNEDAEKRLNERENSGSEDVTDVAEIIFAKMRMSATGMVELNFRPKYGEFA